MLRINILIPILICCFIWGCQNKAFNKELVFKTYSSTSKEYKNKLAEKISQNKEITYTFEQYINDQSIQVVASGEDFEAKCMVTVKNWIGIEGIREAKGGGYRYAELYGLKLDVIDDPSGAIFVYKDVDFIID